MKFGTADGEARWVCGELLVLDGEYGRRRGK